MTNQAETKPRKLSPEIDALNDAIKLQMELKNAPDYVRAAWDNFIDKAAQWESETTNAGRSAA